MGKIITLDETVRLSKILRDDGKTIVTTNGSFDLLHAGHVQSLSYAKSLGDVLFMGMNSDRSIKRYKSPDRPVISENNRAFVLSHIDCVDYLIIMDMAEISIPLVKACKPNVHVKGVEYKGRLIEEETIHMCGGRVEYVPQYDGLSTTGIIRKIKGMK